jgi:uncharacterized repeat protein (TIGR03803 family)
MKSKKHSRRFEGVAAVVASTLILMGTAQAGDKFRILHDFLAKPAFSPVAALVADSAGKLYGTCLYGWDHGGTTEFGGDYGGGTVFELSPSGGKWIERVLYSFGRPQGDLVFPLSTLTLDTRGNLYGTASGGGTYPAGAGGSV